MGTGTIREQARYDTVLKHLRYVDTPLRYGGKLLRYGVSAYDTWIHHYDTEVNSYDTVLKHLRYAPLVLRYAIRDCYEDENYFTAYALLKRQLGQQKTT